MQIEWQGYYLDGRTAARQRAVIHLTPSALQISTENGAVLLWPYEEVRQTQGFYVGEQVRLEKGGEFPEVLLIADEAFLTSLHRFVPGLRKRFHDPAQRRTRARLTLLAALAAAVITAALYLWGLPAMAGFLASRVPVSWEEHLGQAVMDHLAPSERQCRETNRGRAINEIMTTLTTPRGKSPYIFKVIVVDDPAVNAFAAPGGYIVVFRGLLELTQSAEELAGVMAHELQHILQRHATQAVLYDASAGLLLAALFGDSSRAATYGLESARVLGALRYSRRQEEEADAEGMRMLLAAGINPTGIITFFETMKKKSSEGPAFPAYLSTHPTTEGRIERLKSLAGKPRQNSIRLLKEHGWKDIRRICSVSKKPETKGR